MVKTEFIMNLLIKPVKINFVHTTFIEGFVKFKSIKPLMWLLPAQYSLNPLTSKKPIYFLIGMSNLVIFQIIFHSFLIRIFSVQCRKLEIYQMESTYY